MSACYKAFDQHRKIVHGLRCILMSGLRVFALGSFSVLILTNCAKNERSLPSPTFQPTAPAPQTPPKPDKVVVAGSQDLSGIWIDQKSYQELASVSETAACRQIQAGKIPKAWKISDTLEVHSLDIRDEKLEIRPEAIGQIQADGGFELSDEARQTRSAMRIEEVEGGLLKVETTGIAKGRQKPRTFLVIKQKITRQEAERLHDQVLNCINLK